MRLLKRLPNGSIVLESFNDDHLPPYAILSHTWIVGQEAIFTELEASVGRTKEVGWRKIDFCINRAKKDGLVYCWVDTCCIDKSWSAELSTAVNSMFRYYQNAAKCYAYLSDVCATDEVNNRTQISTGIFVVVPHPRIDWRRWSEQSRWFTRGWTLQELLAPKDVDFFSAEGNLLGNKTSLEESLHKVTGIPVEALRGQSLTTFSVHERMRWTVGRTTTRREDKVYCLLGISGVFLPLIYGEGEEYAALRLEDEIQKHNERRSRSRMFGPSPVQQPASGGTDTLIDPFDALQLFDDCERRDESDLAYESSEAEDESSGSEHE